MKMWRLWPVAALAALAMLVAVTAIALPKVMSAGSGVPGADGSLAAIGICVNGQVIDKAHVGIADITVTASSEGQPDAEVTSVPDGHFTFEDLQPGPWQFSVDAPAGWDAVTPRDFGVDLTYGHQGCYEVRFKLNPVGCLVATKTDAQDRPLGNWNVRLSGPSDPARMTDTGGVARFEGLVPGTYRVTEEVRYGWQPTTAASATVKVHAATGADDCAQVQFKNRRLPSSCIDGTKVNENIEPLMGWQIYVQPAAGGGPTFMTTTNQDGTFHFPNLILGKWAVWEENQPDWTPLTPARLEVTLTEAGDECAEVRFRNRTPDLCAEGSLLDEKGAALAGWTLTATSVDSPAAVVTTTTSLQPPAVAVTDTTSLESSAVEMTTTTDSRGRYRLIGLLPGQWRLQVEPQTGWEPIGSDETTFQAGGSACIKVSPLRMRSPRACVVGYARDDNQAGLAGWKVSLRAVGGKTVQEQLTDGTGRFRFGDLPLGDYELWTETRREWEALSPPRMTAALVATEDGACAEVEFISRLVERDICIDGYQMDTFGKVGLPGVVISAEVASDVPGIVTSDVMTATTDGIGYFRFAGLEAGRYRLSVQPVQGWTASGPSSQVVTVNWPPAYQCTRVQFWSRQSPTVTPASTNAGPNTGSCRAWYIVKPGDTLANIAWRHRVATGTLLSRNGIANPNKIFPGQKLCIP